MLQMQKLALNTILANQSTQEKSIENIARTQKVVLNDIKELKRPQNPSERPLSPPSVSQPALTMANIVQQSISQQAAAENAQEMQQDSPHEVQSCASSILLVGDSIFRNVYMEKIKKQTKSKVTVVKAYSSAYDNNKNNKFKKSYFTDLVPKELNKAKHDALVMQASSTDLTNKLEN